MTARAEVDGRPLAFVDGEWREDAVARLRKAVNGIRYYLHESDAFDVADAEVDAAIDAVEAERAALLAVVGAFTKWERTNDPISWLAFYDAYRALPARKGDAVDGDA